MDENLGRLDRTQFVSVHEETLYVQGLFPGLPPEAIRPETFSYPPSWAVLDPGMTMERHHHAFPEFYVFVKGRGTMLLGERSFSVEAGQSVNIPDDWVHEVSNAPDAVEPLIWVSIGLTPPNAS